ncbi:MAG: competence protein CoiA family protein [Candidatus Omnitrophota bacterium]
MKYALVNGQRQEAQPGLPGICPACKSPLVAKCGKVRVPYWSHRGKRNCDIWWENETEWHRNWKDKFPKDWQEVIHSAENGERHIADVKTDQGWVLEFQYSKINPDERKAREAFYKKLVWIIDGARRKRDKTQFFKLLKDQKSLVKDFVLLRIPFSDECALSRDWANSPAPILFDFSEFGKPEEPYLWWVIGIVNGMAYVVPFLRQDFIKYHSPEAKENDRKNFSELWGNFKTIIELVNRPPQVVALDPLATMLQHRRMRRL